MPISLRFVVRSSIGLLAVVFLVLLAIVGTTAWLGERARIIFDDVSAERDIRTAAVELRDALRTAESSERGYVFTGNEIYLAPYDASKAQASRQMEKLNRLLGARSRTQMLTRLGVVTSDKLTEMDQTIRFKREGRDADALALFRTNRGKALMDEANLFLSSVILNADELLTAEVDEQRANAATLRFISIAGGVVIVLAVGIVIMTVTRYTREIRQARDEVSALNAALEERVRTRTAELVRSRERAEVLLAEVNHRVANSLTLVASLVQLQSRVVQDQAAKDALAETQGRILAISLLHKRLYSSGDARFVALGEYLSGLLEHVETSMRAEGHTARLVYDIAPLQLSTDAAINLSVVVVEWVTNAFKYAYPETPGEVRVCLKRLAGEQAELTVADDGVGRPNNAAAKGTGLGSRIVAAMASTMGAHIEYLPRQPGTLARTVFNVSRDAQPNGVSILPSDELSSVAPPVKSDTGSKAQSH